MKDTGEILWSGRARLREVRADRSVLERALVEASRSNDSHSARVVSAATLGGALCLAIGMWLTPLTSVPRDESVEEWLSLLVEIESVLIEERI